MPGITWGDGPADEDAAATPTISSAPAPTRPGEPGGSSIVYYPDLIQGSDEWLAARCGMLTASEMKLIITPNLTVASNDKQKMHFNELLAQRISRYVEPHYVSEDMLRGVEDEIKARATYEEHYAPGEVQEMGFVTNSRWGFTLGCSPDALVGRDGLLECKSRRQKYQIQTIIDDLAADRVPADYVMQVQTALLVTERLWLDFVSYSGGLPMVVIRVWPDPVVQNAIIEAATAFEDAMLEKMESYYALVRAHKLVATERTIEQEMTL